MSDSWFDEEFISQRKEFVELEDLETLSEEEKMVELCTCDINEGLCEVHKLYGEDEEDEDEEEIEVGY